MVDKRRVAEGSSETAFAKAARNARSVLGVFAAKLCSRSSLIRRSISGSQRDGSNGELIHFGPVAQDFYAAFSLGDSDKAIALQDGEGVALAATQGLHKLLRERDETMTFTEVVAAQVPKAKSRRSCRRLRLLHYWDLRRKTAWSTAGC